MKYAELKKVGKLVAENDVYDGFIYLYTDKIWKLGNRYFAHNEHPNSNRYTGKTGTMELRLYKAGDLVEYMVRFGFKLENLTKQGKEILSESDLEYLEWYS